MSGIYTASVYFNLPDSGTYFIKSIAIYYFDYSNGNVTVQLKRRNLYTGAVHTIATVSSSGTPMYAAAFAASKVGYKRLNSFKFAYYVVATFPGGNADLYLASIRIHCGT